MHAGEQLRHFRKGLRKVRPDSSGRENKGSRGGCGAFRDDRQIAETGF